MRQTVQARYDYEAHQESTSDTPAVQDAVSGGGAINMLYNTKIPGLEEQPAREYRGNKLIIAKKHHHRCRKEELGSQWYGPVLGTGLAASW